MYLVKEWINPAKVLSIFLVMTGLTILVFFHTIKDVGAWLYFLGAFITAIKKAVDDAREKYDAMIINSFLLAFIFAPFLCLKWLVDVRHGFTQFMSQEQIVYVVRRLVEARYNENLRKNIKNWCNISPDDFEKILKLIDIGLAKKKSRYYADLFYYKCKLLSEKGDKNSVLHILNKEMDIDDIDLSFVRGEVLFELGEEEAAYDAFAKAKFWENIPLDVLVAKGYYREAWNDLCEELERLNNERPEDWESKMAFTYLKLAKICVACGDFHRALKLVNYGLVYDPEHASLLNLKESIEQGKVHRDYFYTL